MGDASNPKRVCLVYDCLFPYTIGGAERWYRGIAERLVQAGHDVTYLTLRQWPRGTRADVPGVRVVAVGPRMRLYSESGRRRIAPPLVFGAGVLVHLLRSGRRYDVLHTASFPYFSLLAAAVARPRARFRLIADWHEMWSDEYWRDYLGGLGGRVGAQVQRLCLRVPQQAFCFSRLVERRLRENDVRGHVVLLEGEYAGELGRPRTQAPEPVVLFAGRHIPEKRVPALVPAMARVREQAPELRADIYGDGPERAEVRRLVREHRLDGAVRAPGFVDAGVLDEALARALCLVLPSQREGYGMIVVEAASKGVPSVVVAGPDNAATELIEEGVNGFVAASAAPEELASAILRVWAAGAALRESTADWFERNGDRLSLERSLRLVVESYES